MLRTELISGVEKIQHAIESSGMVSTLGATFEGASGGIKAAEIIERLLSTFAKYDDIYRTFTNADRNIVKILGLHMLDDIKWRTRILTFLSSSGAENNRQSLGELHQAAIPVMQFVASSLENIKIVIGLLSRDHGSPTNNLVSDNNEKLTLILAESGEKPSSASRIYRALEAISLFYEVIAELNNKDPGSIYIVACDSGSDKIFDFTGSGDLMKQVKELILGIWDRVLAYKSLPFTQRIEAVKASLPLLSKIAEMESEGKLSEQQALIWRRKIESACGYFLETGSIIPEIKEDNSIRPDNLLSAKEQLLLASPNQSVTLDVQHSPKRPIKAKKPSTKPRKAVSRRRTQENS